MELLQQKQLFSIVYDIWNPGKLYIAGI